MSSFPYEDPTNPAEVGMKSKLVQSVVNSFLGKQQKGEFPGGQLVIRRRGKVVVKLSCGLARGWQARGGNDKQKVEDYTSFPVYSTGKPMAAIVIAMLESQGKLDIKTAVASILPEFGGHGRDDITIEDVLTHRSGIILPELINNHKIWSSDHIL